MQQNYTPTVKTTHLAHVIIASCARYPHPQDVREQPAEDVCLGGIGYSPGQVLQSRLGNATGTAGRDRLLPQSGRGQEQGRKVREKKIINISKMCEPIMLPRKNKTKQKSNETKVKQINKNIQRMERKNTPTTNFR